MANARDAIPDSNEKCVNRELTEVTTEQQLEEKKMSRNIPNMPKNIN